MPTVAIAIRMPISMPNDLALARLMQLVSPSLPIGGYTYSQGIEWAVEQGWITDQDELGDWLKGLLETNLLYLDLPILVRLLVAWESSDLAAIDHWNEYLLASRETFELRQEEINRARAFTRILISLEADAEAVKPRLLQSQLACYSYACQQWHIDVKQAALGYLWSWLENQVLSAVKIIPLGQTAGQKLVFSLSRLLPDVIRRAQEIADDDIGASSLALAIASARHETQYTRLFRS